MVRHSSLATEPGLAAAVRRSSPAFHNLTHCVAFSMTLPPVQVCGELQEAGNDGGPILSIEARAPLLLAALRLSRGYWFVKDDLFRYISRSVILLAPVYVKVRAGGWLPEAADFTL